MKGLVVGIALAMVFGLAASSVVANSSNETIRVWVNFQAGGKAAVGQALRQAGGEVHYEFDELNAFAVTIPVRALSGLSRNPNVAFIEEDPKRFPASQSTPYGITMVQATQVSDANAGNRMVCVIDSGYNLGHEDLPSGGSLITGGADGGSGPWHQDGNGHGTHVAGTIVALNNSVGVVGVLPSGNLRMHIVRVFNDRGSWSYSSGLVGALNECRKAGANVVNMSLGGSFKSRNEENAFNQANNAGVLSVAAAGNGGSGGHFYPASYSSVVSVAAIDGNKQHASFSQRNNQVELAAPGVDVRSTVPGGYAHYTGTSMASPHVAGVAALIWSHYPSCTNADVRSAMNSTAEDLGAAGRDNLYGWGLVRAKAALDHLALQSCAGSGGGGGGSGDDGGGGGGGEEPPPSCGAAGTSCTADSECCNKCTGRRGARTCN